MKIKYGLPEKIIFCKKCLMSNQQPYSINETTHTKDSKKETMVIDESHTCEACKYNEIKKNIDWEYREKLLEKMLNNYRSKDSSYDCIVAGSGGKDSSMTSHVLKYKYGMKPLTITFAPIMYTDVGKQNMENWINIGGFDNLLFTPNGKVLKKLTYEAFKNLYFPMQPFKFGIKFWALKMALKFNIKLVMYGEPYIEYGSTPLKESESPKLELKYFVNNTKNINLGGLNLNQIKEKYNFKDNDLKPYMPIRSDEIKGKNVTVEYLGWYLKWDPQEAYYHAAENCGFNPDDLRTDGTYGKYSSIDDKIDGLHFFTRYIKFGLGRATYDASQEIRNGHITREEGLLLQKKFDGEFPKRYFKDCLNYMNIDEDYFWKITDEARSEHLWKKSGNDWKLRYEPE
tara:strand:- start:427 stop:1623 length:1197 start_codon:yes stop_codon:yes gene_type:complete